MSYLVQNVKVKILPFLLYVSLRLDAAMLTQELE
jgi:hypothetical protein